MSTRSLAAAPSPGSSYGGLSGRSLIAAICAVAVVALAVRLPSFIASPLWTDELFSAFYPKAGLAYLWTEGLHTEPTAPLYYTLLAAMEAIGGTTVWAVRLPSLLASVLGIWLVYRLALELFGRRSVAVVAALILALAPGNIYFAAEARSYALQGAALTLALLGLARFLRDGTGLLAFGAGATLAIWLHPTSIPAVASIDLAALTGLIGPTRLIDGRALRRWILTNVGVAILCAPLIPALLSSGNAAATAWIGPFNRYTLEYVLGWLLGGPALSKSAYVIAERAIPLLALLFLFPPWRGGRRALTVLLAPALLALFAMIAISLNRPILLNRTAVWMLAPLAVALADVIMRRPRLVAVPVLLVIGATTAVHLWRTDHLKENWPAFFAGLPEFGPPALIVLAPHTSPATVAFYAPSAGAPVRLDDGVAVPETTVIPRVLGTKTISRDELAAAIASGRRVWLLYRRPEYGWVQKTIAGLPQPVVGTAHDNPDMDAVMWKN